MSILCLSSVFISGDCYMSCVVSAVDDKEDRISKLTSYFRNQQIVSAGPDMAGRTRIP